MIARIQPKQLNGTIRAVPSKSQAHRMLICAALCGTPVRIHIGATSEDIEATIRVLRAFGAAIEWDGCTALVRGGNWAARCMADCGESGSTLRFLLPVAGALGIDAAFVLRGRLGARPIAPLDRELTRGGCTVSRGADTISISGSLRAGEYRLPGNVSSQYISGLLMALQTLDAQSRITIEGALESAAYVDMTINALRAFGAEVCRTEQGFAVAGGGYRAAGNVEIEGDWSNAAFWLCANAIAGSVRVDGLNLESAQGDRRVVQEIEAICAGKMHFLDASGIPDLAPALAALAAARGQGLRIAHAERLRMKESDRIASIVRAINALGGCARETEDGLIIESDHGLSGGAVDAAGDHRIAMMAAIASIGCSNEVIVRGAEAVNKSYPAFWRDFQALGGDVKLEEERA